MLLSSNDIFVYRKPFATPGSSFLFLRIIPHTDDTYIPCGTQVPSFSTLSFPPFSSTLLIWKKFEKPPCSFFPSLACSRLLIVWCWWNNATGRKWVFLPWIPLTLGVADVDNIQLLLFLARKTVFFLLIYTCGYDTARVVLFWGPVF